MTAVAPTPPNPPSGASFSAASEIGPALRIRGLRLSEPRPSTVFKPGLIDVGLLGVTIVLGGQYFNWNATLAAGIVPAIVAFGCLSFAYLVLMFSLAEITSVFPFAGGAYAITRKTHGLFVGFLVGAIDATEFVLYVSASVVALADMVVTSVPSLGGLEPLLWGIFFVSATLLQTRGHSLFWRVDAVLGICSLVVLAVFCLGSLAQCDIRKYSTSVMDPATRTPLPAIQFMHVLRVFPFCAWFFAGVDAIAMAADHVPHSNGSSSRDTYNSASNTAREVIPHAQRMCMVVLLATGVSTFFVTVSLPAGTSVLADATAPLSYGLSGLLGVSLTDAVLLSLPATYATAFGFLWAFGRLVTSLAASGLLPRWLTARIHQHVRHNHSVSSPTAVGLGAALSFFVCLVVHYGKSDRPDRHVTTRVCIGLAFLSYIAQTLGFIALRHGGGAGRGAAGGVTGDVLAQSAYRSPFGVWGAYAALVVWVLGFLSVVGFQDSGFRELVVIVSLLSVFVVYYYWYARHHQVISIDERGVVLAAASAVSVTGGSGSWSPKPSAGPRTAIPSAPPTSTQGSAKSADGSFKSADGSFRKTKMRISFHSDADSSFQSNGGTGAAGGGGGGGARSGSGSMRVFMPELVRAESRLNNLLEEYPELTDDMDEPYVQNWLPAQQQQQLTSQPPTHTHAQSLSQLQPSQLNEEDQKSDVTTPPEALANLAPLRRAGSDGLLQSTTRTNDGVGGGGGGGGPRHHGGAGTLFSGGWAQSFLARNGRLEKLREETERDLRSAVSGIWPSERSARWSRGRAS